MKSNSQLATREANYCNAIFIVHGQRVEKGGTVNNITFPGQEFRLTLVCGFFFVARLVFVFPFVLQFLNCGHNMQKKCPTGRGTGTVRREGRGRGHSIKSSN